MTADDSRTALLSRHPGVYAIQHERLDDLMAALESRQELDAAGRTREGYTTPVKRVGMVSITGVITKGFYWPGMYEDSQRVRSAIRSAVADKSIDAIVLRIDSPGGMVAGTQEMADDIRTANGVKPVHAFIEDLGASAAYWAASQAGTITANATAEVGSIGVLAVVADMSEMAANEGVKVHVVATGPYKGAFVPGAEVPEKHLDYLQSRVDDTMGHFQAAVTQGRGLTGEALDRVSDGRVWGAAESQRLGLIDRVGSLDSMLTEVGAGVAQARAQRRAGLARAAVARSRLES